MPLSKNLIIMPENLIKRESGCIKCCFCKFSSKKNDDNQKDNANNVTVENKVSFLQISKMYYKTCLCGLFIKFIEQNINRIIKKCTNFNIV